MKACLLAIGSELLRPGFRETHSDWLTPRLEREGFEITHRAVVPDDPDAITASLAQALRLGSLVVATGGIGPTRDDRTREAAARALGRSLRLDPRAESQIRAWCRRHRFPFTSAQRRQALIPEGGSAIRNRIGSAPGVWYSGGSGVLVVLPGVPSEMMAMFERLLPRIGKLGGDPVATCLLRTAGVGETRIDHRIRRAATLFPEVEVTTLASPGEVSIQLRGRGPLARRSLSRCRLWLCRLLRDDLVSEKGETLEAVVHRLLLRRRWRLSVAESCTAGLVSARLTRVPGVSAVFEAGAVCYNDRAKERMLSVPRGMLERHGAVSRPVALAMARGASRAYSTHVAVAVTGIAGPGGGSPRKPVGTVVWALTHPGGETTRRRRLAGDREKIRIHAACIALDLVRRVLLQHPSRSRRV